MNSKRSLQIYAFVAGLFFIISGFGKMFDTSGFALLIQQYGLETFSVFAPLIAVTEIVLGVFLMLFISPKQTAFYALIMMLLFTSAYAYAYFVHGIEDCGCFGSIKQLAMPPWLSFLRNGILMAMLLLIWIYHSKTEFSFQGMKAVVILVVIGISIFISGLTFNKSYFTKLVKPAKETETKKERKIRHIQYTRLPNFLTTSPDSTYAIIAFSYSCPHCLNSIENINKYEEAGIVDRVIGLATGSNESRKDFYTYFKPDFDIRDLSHAEMLTITKKVPTIFFVKHDSIRFVIRSVAPSPLTLKKEQHLDKYF